MNKKLAVVLAALMMLSTTTFLAAGSPVSNDVTVETEGVTISTTETVEMDATTATTIITQYADTAVEAEDVTPVAVFVIDENSVMPADKKVTFTVEGVVDGDNVIALHLYNNEWVERAASVVNGKVVVNFGDAEHFSPIIIAKVETTTATTTTPYNGAHFATTLPKTGAVAVLPVAAMACLAGAVACGRKEK